MWLSVQQLWEWIIKFSLHLFYTFKSTSRWVSETKSIELSLEKYGVKSLSESFSEPSIFVTDCSTDIANTMLMTEKTSYLSIYTLAAVFSVFIHCVFLYKVNKGNANRISRLQYDYQIPLVISGEILRWELARHETKVKYISCNHNQRFRSLSPFSESDDDPCLDWRCESSVTSQTDISMLQGNSVRFKRTTNTGFLQDDFTTLRSSAISLLLWDTN
ncbi:hypothetical protein HG535_0A03580 [Zygotorulaspora mrakii]|uniref:Uncharacterized protein n=1 Tax=Zygotorulaspora mrakii TaxID=42260 RepID=A0A7H9AXA9_ZYGMR|nr:uncharacterized protein HG535_0A03580 [Zygotorulaspora mrakii]QLG70419.1 hypothetical protein HG535_0A03580 [Zygotorulaspora mrakii]